MKRACPPRTAAVVVAPVLTFSHVRRYVEKKTGNPPPPVKRKKTDLHGDAEERPVLLGKPLGDDEADNPSPGEGHEYVVRGEEVGDLRGGPAEAVVDVVVAGGEDVQGEDEQEVAESDPQQRPVIGGGGDISDRVGLRQDREYEAR